MRAILFAAIILASAGCIKDVPDPALQEFSDDFEDYTQWEDMVQEDGSRWTKFNINEINTSASPIQLDTIIVRSGKQSVRFHCRQADPEMKEICKCNLNKEGLYFKAGDVVYYSAWYYVQRSDSAYGTFFIWDLEAVVDATLGVRVMAWEENMEFERNKMGASNIFQEGDITLFPVNRWTRFELEVKLSQARKGYVKMWLDGKEIMNRDNIRTLPKDRITLAGNTHGYYDRLQAGITAKSGTEELVVYMDDLEIKKR
jgi:hypothetical protein